MTRGKSAGAKKRSEKNQCMKTLFYMKAMGLQGMNCTIECVVKASLRLSGTVEAKHNWRAVGNLGRV